MHLVVALGLLSATFAANPSITDTSGKHSSITGGLGELASCMLEFKREYQNVPDSITTRFCTNNFALQKSGVLGLLETIERDVKKALAKLEQEEEKSQTKFDQRVPLVRIKGPRHKYTCSCKPEEPAPEATAASTAATSGASRPRGFLSFFF